MALVMVFIVVSAQPESKQQIVLTPEAYLEYIKTENSAVRAQITELQKTIQEERKAHYEFVEGIYRWSAIGVSVLMGVIAFLGLQSRQQIRKDLDDFLKATVRDPVLLNKLLAMVKSELSLESGAYLLFADESLHEGLQSDIQMLKERGIKVALKKPGDSTKDADVLIYRFNPENVEDGEDSSMKKFIDALQKEGLHTPFVVYAPNRLWVKGSSLKALENYGLYHMANNSISLIDNVASAFRVSKLRKTF